MGTLSGTVPYEIEWEESVKGVADVVEHHFGSGEQVYVDYMDNLLHGDGSKCGSIRQPVEGVKPTNCRAKKVIH